MWSEPVRKKVLLEQNIPPSVIDQFEAACPDAVMKMNPLKRNSPKLYDRKAFDDWWDERIRKQRRARRMTAR